MRPLPAPHLSLFLLLLAACGSGEGGAAENAPAGPPAQDTRPFVAFPAAGVPNSDPERVPDPGIFREHGIGVIGFDPGPGLSGRVADSLEVTADTMPGSPVVARLVLDTTAVFRFEAREGMLAAPGALDYGYEEVGLPVLDRAADGWLRVHLGQAADGAPVSGWTRVRAGVLALTLWEDLLPGMPLFFTHPDSARFHEARDGAEARFDVSEGYILWPLSVDGDWMRVRAVSPSNYCFEPPRPPREDTLWIRWRGDDARPRVWFFTRGC